MKVRFNREEMADALSAVCSVAAARTPKPILQCVRIEALSDVVLLSATDLEVSLRYGVTQVDVNQAGQVVVTADTLQKIVRECGDELLVMELSKNILHIRGSGSHFQIVTQNAAEFPPVGTMEGDPDFRIELGVMRRLIEWTAFAAARESSRYAINGVLWELTGERLTLVATDGRRLSKAAGTVTWRKTGDPTPAVIVPTKAVGLFSRLPGPPDASVAVQVHPNQVLVSVGAATLSTALVEGHFPRYQDVIPVDNDKCVELSTVEFQGALKQAQLLTNEESKSVRLSFSPDSLVLASRAPEVGEATINIPVRYKGEPLEIGFNPVFLLDVVRVAHADEIRLSLKESNRPGILEVDQEFLHVVMPVSLTSA